MALFSAAQQNWTPIAVADATNFTNAGYLALLGASATARYEVVEVYIGGLAAASAAAQMLFGRDSVIGASSLSGGTNAALDPSGFGSAGCTVFSTSTTKPQRSATLGALLTLSFNAQGGVIRWKVSRAQGEGIFFQGNTAVLNGEVSLSHAANGTPGLLGSHIIYEPQ